MNKKNCLLFLSLIFAQFAIAQLKVDTTVIVPCGGFFDITKLVPPPYPKETLDTVHIVLNDCVPDLLKKTVTIKSACAKTRLHLDSLVGRNSCNNISKKGGYPIAYCVRAENAPRSIVYVDIDPDGATHFETFQMHFFLPLENVNDNQPPSNSKDPNNIQEVVVNVFEDGMLKRTVITPVLSKHPRDTAFWVSFFIDLDMQVGKKYQLQLYGSNPIYPNRSLSLMDFFGFRAVYSCKELGKSCTWSGSELILVLDDACEPANWYRWTSTCLDTFIAKVARRDTTSPIITRCQRDTIIRLKKYMCLTDFNVLPIATFEDCTDTTVIIKSDFGTIRGNGGILTGVGVGKHTITYCVSDGCGNSTTCSFVLTVLEGPFSIICDSKQTVVSISTDSCGRLYGDKLHIVTDSLCCTFTTTVQRMDRQGPSGKYIELCCSDIGKVVMVIVTVTSDCDSSLKTTCMKEVIVQDKSRPKITCPPDLAIDCSFPDTTLFVKYGRPMVEDECAYTLTESHVINLNACKNGTAVLTWVATDASGNTSSCSQTIFIFNPSKFNESHITWPANDTLYACVPDTTPDKTGRPIIVEPGCANDIQYYWRDAVSHVQKGGICRVIERTWTVRDFCLPSSIIFTHVQRIVLRDTVRPVITCPRDTIIGNLGTCDSKVKVVLPPVTASDCNGILSITNNSLYSKTKGADASGEYPIGVHHITYVVTDSCGNTATCKTTVTVVDKKPPTPFCLPGIIIVLANMPGVGPMASVWAKDLNHKSWDDCCKDTLTFSFSGDSIVMSKIFTCADVGDNIVEMWVYDCHGNKSFCKTKVVVQDNSNLCPPGDTMHITGTVHTVSGMAINHVVVALNAQDTVIDHRYRFDSLSKGKYELRPTKTDNVLDGVSTADIVKIQRHILGIAPFVDPYQLIAADVTNDRAVTSGDLADIRRVILGATVAFRNNTSWRFIPETYIFPDALNPWKGPFPESSIYDPLKTSAQADFIGIKIGDVNGSATGALKGEDTNLQQRVSTKDLAFIDSLYASAVAFEEKMVTALHTTSVILQVYPNPASDEVTIVLPESTVKIEAIVDTRGVTPRCMQYLQQGKEVRLNLEQYPQGVYTLLLTTKDRRYVARVIKL